MSWMCKNCEFLMTDELGSYNYRDDNYRHHYCTNFPRKKKEIRFSIFKANNDPKWCPKNKGE